MGKVKSLQLRIDKTFRSGSPERISTKHTYDNHSKKREQRQNNLSTVSKRLAALQE